MSLTSVFTLAFRPDDMFATVSVDSYSFPSGHATRAILLAAFHAYTSSDPVLWLASSVWAMIVAASRVVLGRHHVFDVIAGVAIGYLVFRVFHGHLWLSEEQAVSFQKMMYSYLHSIPYFSWLPAFNSTAAAGIDVSQGTQTKNEL